MYIVMAYTKNYHTYNGGSKSLSSTDKEILLRGHCLTDKYIDAAHLLLSRQFSSLCNCKHCMCFCQFLSCNCKHCVFVIKFVEVLEL